MHSELFSCVVVQKIIGHRRLYRTTAACLLVEEKDVVVRHEDRKLEFAVIRIGLKAVLTLCSNSHCHFSNTVEVDVIGTDKLVNLCIL